MRLILLLLAAELASAQDVPQWVRQEAARPAPAYPPKLSSVVLFHEEQLTVTADGRWTMRERGAIRVLQSSRDRISASRSYDVKAGRIRDIRGWLLPPGGAARLFRADQAVDVSLTDPGQVYDEARAKVLDCPSAPAGSVFAYEIVEEQKTSFTQYFYAFQGSRPVLVSRFVLSLPSGWEMKDVMFNHAPVRASSEGGAYTWELRDLPWLEAEEHAPPLSGIAPGLGVTFYPGDSAAPLKDWGAVSNWVSGLVEPAASASGPIRGKSGELAGSGSALGKIRSVASFAQKVNYVSVQMNVTRGGGYTPHPAEQVLARNYGDCKDKAALMKALLAAAGIESYVALAYSSERRHVREGWPSPEQFNHAIVAVRVPPEVNLPTVLDHPRLGRLLFFDPTDPYTQLGDLPEDEQGSRMLVLAGAKGELVTAPALPVSTNRVESTVEGRLDPNGALTANLERRYYGQSAAMMRALAVQPEKDAVRRAFEAGFAQRIGGVTLSNVEVSDHASDQRFEAKARLEAKTFAQIQAKLLLSKPASIVPGVRYVLPAKERKLPIEVRASQHTDRVSLKLPDGYKVDEIPEPLELSTTYGTYRAKYAEESGSLIFDQFLEIRDVAVAAAEYSQVRDFFGRIAGYQQAAVVLVKQ
jgi:hypothetical protein